MKKLLILIPFILLSTFLFSQGQKNFIDLPYIEVSGTAELEVTPNEIYLKIVIDEDDNAKVSVEKLEQKMLKTLQALGIDLKEQLKVKDQSSDFKKHVIKKDKIQTAKEFELLVYDAPTMAKVFIELEEEGISNINIIKLDHSEMDKLKLDVKVMAIKAAKKKAIVFTQAIDQEIGQAIHIVERQAYTPNFRNMANTLNEVASFGNSTPQDLSNQLEFDKIKLSATVDVKFELKTFSKRGSM